MKLIVIPLLALLFVYVQAITNDEKWIAYKEAYGKTYKNEVEDHKRKEIFLENLNFIDENNRLLEAGKAEHKWRVNIKTDLGPDERHSNDLCYDLVNPDHDSPTLKTLDEKWAAHRQKYGRIFKNNEAENQRRKAIYGEHVQLIDEHNKLYEEGKVDTKWVTNINTDLPIDEIQPGQQFYDVAEIRNLYLH